jgi:diguanylate cyclase (GGDEF)-like protein
VATLAMVDRGQTIPVTVSVGVATAGPTELGVSSLIKRADDGLYQAKREGRDRSGVAALSPAEPETHGTQAAAATSVRRS